MVPSDIPPKAVKYYEDAVATLKEEMAQRRGARNTEQVIDDLRKAIYEYPKFLQAWRLLGEIYLGLDQPLPGYLALQRAYYIKGDDPDVLTLLAEASLILDRPALALKYLEPLQTGEETLVIKKLTALSLARSEQWEEALRAFGKALADDPSDGDLRRECAEVLSVLGYPKEAASVLADYLDPSRDFIENEPDIADSGWVMPLGAVLDRLSAGAQKEASKRETVAHPEDFRAWYQLGNIFLDGEQWGAAVACFRRALRLHPDFYDALHNMGMALEELDRPEEALRMYEEAIEADPESPEAYLSAAELLESVSPEETDDICVNYLTHFCQSDEIEGFDEMEPFFLARLDTAPDIAQMLLLAQIYYTLEQFDKAERLVRKIESAGAGEADVQLLKGQILNELGKGSEAEQAFRKGLDNLDSTDSEAGTGEDIEPRLLFELALLLSDSGRESEAVALLKESGDILDADCLCLLAELTGESNPKEAEAYWQKALDIDPEHMDSLIGLADHLTELKKLEPAITLLERAFKVDPDDEETVQRLAELYPEIGADELSPVDEEQSEEE
jgi:tetratricopeptide (TPR) repeat protein